MSTIVPPLPGPPAAQPQAALQVLTLAAGDLSDALPAGSQMEATVLPPQPGQPPNLVEVATAGGPLLLRGRGDLTLPAGTTLTLQVAGGTGTAAVTLRLVALNGRPLLPGGLPLPVPSGAVSLPLPPGPGMPSSPLLAGRPAVGQPLQAPTTPGMTSPTNPGAAAQGPFGLTAILLRPAANPAAVSAQQAGQPAGPLPPGTRFVLRIAEVIPAPTAAADPEAPTHSAIPAGTVVPNASGPSPPQVAPTVQAGPAGTMPAPAGSAQPADPLPLLGEPEGTLAATPSLAGTVSGHAPGNQAMVETAFGTLALPAADELPVGAGVVLQLVAPPLPPHPAAAPAAQAPPGLGAEGWPALAESMATLGAADDGAMLQALVRQLPQIGPQLAANLSLFANALSSGKMRAIFGGDGPVRGLDKAGRRDLVQRLKSDFEELSEASGRPVGGGDWRCFTMPLLNGAEIIPIHLYVRRPPADDEQGSAAGGRHGAEHRFLLEVDLSRLGRIQLDGLVQRENKRFDLIIRTDRPFPEEMRRDILGLFALSGDVVGTKGSVSFQPGGRFVDLPPVPPPATSLCV